MPSNNYQRTAAWLHACGKERRNPEHVSTAVGVHIEELSEQLELLRVSQDGWAKVLERATTDLRDLAAAIKSGKITAHVPQHLRVGFLKELCDGEITGNGVAYLLGMDKESADTAVLESNDSKLNPDGTVNIAPGGKIIKPAGWMGPDLRPYC